MLRLKKLSRLALRPTCMLPRPMLLTHRPARPLNTSSSDPYTVLGLERNCSENDLREAYLFLSRAHHPDNPKNKDDPNSAKQKFIAVQEAYRELLNHKQVMGKGFGDGQEHAQPPVGLPPGLARVPRRRPLLLHQHHARAARSD